MKALIGKKIGMTRVINNKGEYVAVTVIEAGPCTVTQIKDKDADGYEAIQIGFGLNKHPSKPLKGHLGKIAHIPKVLKEFRSVDSEMTLGQELTVADFVSGDIVEIRSRSKGKGFAGNIKRHNFNAGPKTHGSCNYRKPGSIGSMYPQKVFKGKRMAGHMGSDNTTLKGVRVEYIDKEHNLIAVKGAVPGPKRGIVAIRGQKV